MDVEVLTEHSFDFIVLEQSNSHLEESCFLLQEPFAQLLIPAVRKTTNEMRYIIILIEFLVVLMIKWSEYVLLSWADCLLIDSAFKG